MDLENASQRLKHQLGRGFWGKVLAMKVSEAYTSYCHWAVFNIMPMLCVSMWRPSYEINDACFAASLSVSMCLAWVLVCSLMLIHFVCALDFEEWAKGIPSDMFG